MRSCIGQRTVSKEASYTVTVPAGAPDPYVVTLSEAGDQYPGRPTGSVKVTCSFAAAGAEELESEVLVRSGADLWAGVNVTLQEALTGFERRFRHWNGTDIVLTHAGVSGVIMRAYIASTHSKHTRHPDLNTCSMPVA